MPPNKLMKIGQFMAIDGVKYVNTPSYGDSCRNCAFDGIVYLCDKAPPQCSGYDAEEDFEPLMNHPDQEEYIWIKYNPK